MPAQIRYWFARQPLDVLEREFSILEGIMLAKREAAKFSTPAKERKKRADAGRKRHQNDCVPLDAQSATGQLR